MASKQHRQAPSVYKPVGFEIATPDHVLVTSGAALTCAETRDGKTVGELSVEPFRAALIVDRDGILEEKVRSVSTSGAVLPVELPGASGYRAQTIAKQSPLPYLHVVAVAPIGVDGGVLVVMRSMTPTWPTGDAILSSLRLLTRKGVANDGGGGAKLPFAGG